jgi:hypothetical protein
MRDDTVTGLAKAFPSDMATEVAAALALLPDSQYPPTESVGPIRVGGESIEVPHRIYSVVPCGIECLSPVQQKILSCLYSRHHDGRTRQNHLERLFPSAERWVAPFVVQLLGEYVIEIIEVLATHSAELESELYRQFVAENPRFIALTRQRVVSYWDCYYRGRYPHWAEYVGAQVLEKLTGGAMRRAVEQPHAADGRRNPHE